MAAREASPGPLRYRLWCGGLHKDITEDEIRDAVGQIAEVKAVILRSSAKDTFCFIQLTNQKDMDKAIEMLDQSTGLGERVCAQPATADKKKFQERQDRPPRRQDSRSRREAPGGKGGYGYGRGDSFNDRRPMPRSRTPGRGERRDGGRRSYQDGERGRSYQEEWRDRDQRDFENSRWRDDGRQGQGYRERDSRERDYRHPEREPRDFRGRERDPRDRGRDGRDGRDGREMRDQRMDYPPPRGRDQYPGDRYEDRRGDVRQRADSRDFQERGPPRDVYYRGPPVERVPERVAEQPRRRDDFDTSQREKIPVGRHKITVENLPDDMSWVELKDLGKDFGPSVTFAKCYKTKGIYYGMLEFQAREDAETAVRELDHRRVQGSNLRLRAYHGDGPGAV